MTKKQREIRGSKGKVAKGNYPSLGGFHKVDEKNISLMKFINDITYGSYCILTKQNWQILEENLSIKEIKIRRRLYTLEKYGYVRIDRTKRPMKLFLDLTAKKLISDVSQGKKMPPFKQRESSHVLSSKGKVAKGNYDQEKLDWARPHELWVNLFPRHPDGGKMDRKAWNDHRAQLLKLKYADILTGMALNGGVQVWEFPIDDIKVRSTPEKFILRIMTDKSEELFRNPMVAMKHVDDIIDHVGHRLENMFKVKLFWDNRIYAEISKQSFALIRNGIADILLKIKDDLKEQGKLIDINIYDEAGNLLYKPDRSLGLYLPEMDSEGPNAEVYAERLQDLCREVGTGKFNAGEARELQGQAAFLINGLARENLKMAQEANAHRDDLVDYGKKIAAHGQSIEVLGAGIREFTEKTTAFGEGVKRLVELLEKLEKKNESP